MFRTHLQPYRHRASNTEPCIGFSREWLREYLANFSESMQSTLSLDCVILGSSGRIIDELVLSHLCIAKHHNRDRMDIVDTCKQIIEDKLEQLDKVEREDINDNQQPEDFEDDQLTNPTGNHNPTIERDKNLDKILNQQTQLKRIIDQDNHLQMLKSSLIRVSLEVEDLRRNCTKINEEALKSRQESMEGHAKDIDKFQIAQMRSISEDYNRHQEILEFRKKEVQALKKEIEKEEKGRSAYLSDVERKLSKKIEERQKAARGSGGCLNFTTSSIRDETNPHDEPQNGEPIELSGVDEYALYGEAPHSRLRGKGRAPTQRDGVATNGGPGGRGRGRRRRG